MESLTRLKQTKTIEEYKTAFEFLFTRVRGLSKQYKISCFLSSLRDEICLHVRMFNSSSLLVAYSLAKLQEETMGVSTKMHKTKPYPNFIAKNTMPRYSLPNPTTSRNTHKSPLPIQKNFQS